jgi:multidrug resistance efflux pump
MANAADGYLGDWLPHKDKCRCDDCQLDRANTRIRELEAQLAAATRKIERLESAISWALGEADSDFRERKQFEGAYWWRRELRERARPQEHADGKH